MSSSEIGNCKTHLSNLLPILSHINVAFIQRDPLIQSFSTNCSGIAPEPACVITPNRSTYQNGILINDQI